MNRTYPKSLPALATASALGLVLAMTGANADHHLKQEMHDAKEDVKQQAQELKHESKEAMHERKHDTRDAKQEMTGATRNAWLHGKLETALLLNRHLNSFAIDSRVEGETAYLQGTVESEIDKELAQQVALSIKGIDNVENDLTLDSATARQARTSDDDDAEGRTFSQRVEDATTTAVVKTRLVANGHTAGFDINVDTRNDVVTLRGNVKSSEERALAEQVASNTDDVESVVNELQVLDRHKAGMEGKSES